jgi:hypothetical protein
MSYTYLVTTVAGVESGALLIAHGRRLWYAPSIGSEPLMAEVILELVREAADGRLGE